MAASDTSRKNAATAGTQALQGNGDILVNGSITVAATKGAYLFANGWVSPKRPLTVDSPGTVDSFGRIKRHA